MALPLFVVSTVGRALWNEISKQLVTTRLTKYSKTNGPKLYGLTAEQQEMSPDSVFLQISVGNVGKKS
jgi:hypothetical protein